MLDVANECGNGLCVCGYEVHAASRNRIACSGTTPFCGKSTDVGVKADAGDLNAQCQVL